MSFLTVVFGLAGAVFGFIAIGQTQNPTIFQRVIGIILGALIGMFLGFILHISLIIAAFFLKIILWLVLVAAIFFAIGWLVRRIRQG